MKIHLKDGPLPSEEVGFICFNNRPFKIMKNVSYFTVKALFVFKIFKTLS